MKPTKTERIFIRVTAEQKARYNRLALWHETTLSELIIELLDTEFELSLKGSIEPIDDIDPMAKIKSMTTKTIFFKKSVDK